MGKILEGDGVARRRQNRTSPAVYLLVVVFGSSSWLSVNGVWLQLPLLVYDLPEQWSLPSYLAVICQLAVVGPIAFGVFKKLRPSSAVRWQGSLIVASLGFACIVTFFLVLFWQKVSVVGGVEHSVPLFILFFCLALVDCTSNVLFLPYMSVFKPAYTIAYFIGMGCSALVPSLFALVQGSGRVRCINVTNTSSSSAEQVDPNFSVSVFNTLLLIWLLGALCSFCLLNWAKFARNEKVLEVSEEEDNVSVDSTVAEVQPVVEKPVERRSSEGQALGLGQYLYLLLLTAWVCGLQNGVLPSIQSYSCLPYGQTTYHLSVTFSNIANPLACFVPTVVKIRRVNLVVSVVVVVATAFAAYILGLASLSPAVPLLHSTAGPVLCVVAWICVFALLSFLKTVMADKLRSSTESATRLFWYGAFMQIGSFVAALTMFPLVNIFKLFMSTSGCP